MGNTLAIQAKITKCWSRVFFHDTETTSACFSLTATLTGNEKAIRQMMLVCAGDNIARLDFDQNKIGIPGSHSDPLYIFDCNGETGIEVNFYTDVPDGTPILIYFINGERLLITPEIQSEWDFSPENLLRSQVISSELDSISVMMQCEHATEVVYQMTNNGIFQEKRERFPAGRHIVRFPPESLANKTIDYVGLSLNTTLSDGTDIEHKHVFLGRL